MATEVLLIDDDAVVRQLVIATLDDLNITEADCGERGLELFAQRRFDLVICDIVLPGIDGLETISRIRHLRPGQRIMVLSSFGSEDNMLATLRENIVDFVVKPFTRTHLQNAVRNVLKADGAIEVISASRQWIELRVPASFQVVESLDSFFVNLQANIDAETRNLVAASFRELLNNAIEHGCSGDPEGMVSISYVRMKRGILYRIKDPGWGFDFDSIPHAAVSNPEEDQLRHLALRKEMGLRPGGYGLVFLRNYADELIYNESGNEVIFVKYL
jgi:DNA-binding response OmpR family regulator